MIALNCQFVTQQRSPSGSITSGSSLPPVSFNYRNLNSSNSEYSTAYKLFPVEVRDALYLGDPRHKQTLTTDPACGMPTDKTGADGVKWTTDYDAFCRIYDER